MAAPPPPPRLAAMQSLALPGMGQRKLGLEARGKAQMAGAVGSMGLAVALGYAGPPLAYGVLPAFLAALGIWGWSVADAYRLAKHRRTE